MIIITQFSFVVKVVKIIPDCKVQSNYPLYSARRGKRVRPIILNAGCTRFAIRAAISQSVRLDSETRRDSHGDVLGHVPGEILSDIYAKVPTRLLLNGSPEWRRRRRRRRRGSRRFDFFLAKSAEFSAVPPVVLTLRVEPASRHRCLSYLLTFPPARFRDAILD